MIECPMCSHRFEEAEGVACCESCPLGKGCNLLKCPRCGYEIPREPRLVKAIRNWRKKRGTR